MSGDESDVGEPGKPCVANFRSEITEHRSLADRLALDTVSVDTMESPGLEKGIKIASSTKIDRSCVIHQP